MFDSLPPNNKKTSGEWKFFEYKEDEDHFDYGSYTHFEDKEKVEYLVRESIQNSLDAVDNRQKPVKINFKFFKRPQSHEYFQGLDPHLKESGIDFNIEKQDSCRILLIEDFNTSGLEKNRWNYFFKKENITAKEEKRGGSHGMGKAVFSISSEISTFFALSVHEEGKSLETKAAGKAILKTRKIGGTEYKPAAKKEILDIQRFKNYFFVKRKDSEKGLSVVIPFLKKSIQFEDIKKICIQQYYLPILKNKLEITLEGEKVIQINSSNLKDMAEELLKEKISFMEESYSEENIYTLKYPNATSKFFELKKPGSDVYIKGKNSIYKEIAEALRSEEKQLFRVEINFKKNLSGQTLDKKGIINLYCKKQKEPNEKMKADFWRGNLLIEEASNKKFQQIFVVISEEDDLSDLLRATEDPGHTKWEKNREEANKKYSSVKEILMKVERLPKHIETCVRKASEIAGDDYNPIGIYFPLSSSGTIKTNQNTSMKSSQGPIDEIEGQKKDFLIENKNNTITIKLAKPSENKKIRIEIAYSTKGDPFKNYSPEDFDFSKGDIAIKAEGCEEIKKEENILEYEIKSLDDFYVELNGFDENREVTINTNWGID